MRHWDVLGSTGLIISSLWATEAIASSPIIPEMTGPEIAQIQLTEQAPTAVDWILDAVETQPATAEQFILAYPGLSADQAAAIQVVYREYDADLQAAINRYLQSINLLTNLIQPTTTNAAITQVRNDVLDYERQVHDLLFQRAIAIRGILSPEQRALLNPSLRSMLNLGTPIVASTFPAELVGQPAAAVLDQLQLDGWQLSVRTPRTLLLDRADQALDLVIDEDRNVQEAQLNFL
ncbi:MAG: hypothetical protein ACFBSG_19310 [Leptolyngbyaceae cyanobacterium]